MSTSATRRRWTGSRRLSVVDVVYGVEPGRPQPLGATVDATGVNFSLFSRHATGVQLLLFDEHDQLNPVEVLTLDPDRNRTFHFWHVYVRGLTEGFHYAYRVDGPSDPHRGFRFDREKVLLDPYAKGNTNALWEPVPACRPGDNFATSMRGVILDTGGYDWEGDEPLRRPLEESVVYEVHVRGFTANPNAGVEHPGTFAGVVEKIPYLQELGVTAVELLPVFAFDEREVLRHNPVTGEPLRNYWGYDPYLHFAPQASYCVDPAAGGHIEEFRGMVKALHKAGIEVILDVVFNHTGEGNHEGPTISFKGLENEAYYMLAPDQAYYMNYSGCGNTMNANHPVTEKFIADCLEYWVREMHVDGFRFDEGSILHRGPDGAPMQFPPVVWRIELSETLAETKVIAEPWDAGGLYHVGQFPGQRWSEWNGKFRDDVRRFVRGDFALVGAMASRIAGSADLYQAGDRLPTSSVNFVTAHDGFTLNDLVSYNEKHNEANGEGNRDGADENYSWNHGVEGATDDPEVEAFRNRSVKNFAAIMFVSQGVPMIVSGDEVRRTQRGNNNTYCQDNELAWFDWDDLERHGDVFRFFRELIAFRRRHRSLQRRTFFTGKETPRGIPDITWSGLDVGRPPWDEPWARVLAFTVAGLTKDEPDVHVILNMHDGKLDFELPSLEGRTWKRVADTALPAPEDVAEPGTETLVTEPKYWAEGRSVVILETDS
jgi:glycogen operon protein